MTYGKSMSLEEHVGVASRLRTAYAAVAADTTMIHDRLGTDSKQARTARRVVTMLRELRSELEEALVDEHGEKLGDLGKQIYFPATKAPSAR